LVTKQETKVGNGYTTLANRTRRIGDSSGEFNGKHTTFHRPRPLDPLTERSRRIWSAGDYDSISAGFRHEAEAFVDRLGLKANLDVLDAACGSGNLTIPAARTNARVTGLDLVPSLLDQAAMWSAREGVTVRFDEGSVEELPYADGEFDVVMSMFGVMFAARPEKVISELARVTRRGGRVALANWTAKGFVGQMLWKHLAYVPPPAGIASPLLWGDEAAIGDRFRGDHWDVTTKLRTLRFRYPYTPAETAELFRVSYGPTIRTFDALDPERRPQLAGALVDHWTAHQRAEGRGTEVDSEYLEVIAIRR
jgi:2-polyprenyl-3-methyl-5-hydroxy-6-metoxy-1,4-benzoquinol methylase